MAKAGLPELYIYMGTDYLRMLHIQIEWHRIRRQCLQGLQPSPMNSCLWLLEITFCHVWLVFRMLWVAA